MNCEKCQDRGFTEENHGLINRLCNCDKAREVAELYGIPWREDKDDESLSDIAAEANAFANALMPKLEGELDDSNNRTGQPDSDTGGDNPSQPKLKRQSRKTKKAGARAS